MRGGVREVCAQSGRTLRWSPQRGSRKPQAAAAPSPTTTSTTEPITLVPAPVVTDVEPCRLRAPSVIPDHSLGFPRPGVRLRSTGNVKLLVVFVDFPDSPATRSVDSVYSMISPTAQQMFAAMSYGKLQLELIPIKKWQRLPRQSVQYRMSRGADFVTHREYVVDALNSAAGQVDPSGFDGFVIITNPDTSAFNFGPGFTPNSDYWAATALGRRWLNGTTSGTDLSYWGYPWLNHELGHTMGLTDLYAFTGPTHRWVGEWSLMGLNNARGRELFAWERWYLDWLENSQIVCTTGTPVTATLSPIERPGGQKMIAVRIDDQRVLVAESRRKEGFDSGIQQEGVLVYVVDSHIRSGQGPVKVLPINETDSTKMLAPLLPGQSITFERFRVTNLQRSTYGDMVSITAP